MDYIDDTDSSTIMKQCYKCTFKMIHPFHDDGSINEPHVAEFSGIDWFDWEAENRERIQRGN